MHYDAVVNEHGCKHDPFKAIVAPRPVGWVSTLSKEGVGNLAPYSFFNAVSERPHYVMFASGGIKDSLRNILETGEFVCSLATWDLRHAVNISSAVVPYGVNEFPIAGLTTAPSKFVKPPRVKESPAALECRLHQVVELPGGAKGVNYNVVIGQVVGVYVDDAFVRNGAVETQDLLPIARLGGKDYAVIRPDNVFPIGRPVVDAAGNVVVKDAAE